MTCEPWKVKREVNDRIRVFDDAVCHFIAGRRNDGDENRAALELLPKFLDQRASRNDFTNRCRMYPDGILLFYLIELVLWKETETLANALDKAPLAHGADEKDRNDEHNDDDCRKVV